MDSQIQDLIWDVTPYTKPRMTQRDKWLNPPRETVAQYWNYKNILTAYALRDRYIVKPILSIIFVLPMPISWSAKKKQIMNGTIHQAKPDLSNLVKAFEDCLCQSDSYIHTYDQIKKVWGYEGKILLSNNDKKDANPEAT